MHPRLTPAAVFAAVLLFAATLALTAPRPAAVGPPGVPASGAHALRGAPSSLPAPPSAATAPPALGLRDSASILLDAGTGHVLYEHNSGERRAPASLTKIVTVMVALDAAPLTREVTVPASATRWGPLDAVMGLQPGERLTVRELMYGIFLASGNDAAETLAQTLMPRNQFIEAMNARASGLGLSATRFVNPTGMDAAGHYSTAADLAVITRAFVALHGDLLAIASLPSVALYATAGHPEYDLVNLNKLVLWPYMGATGLKTGYTPEAGGCVAATATRGARTLVSVVLGDDVMFTDAGRLFDYGWRR